MATAVASAALLAQPAISPVLLLISKILSRLIPSFSIDTGLDVNSISRDPAVVRAYLEDPLVHGTASARFGTELSTAIAWTQAHAADFDKPLMMYFGDADPLVPPAGSRKFFDNVAANEKALHAYPGGFHEPHNDLDRQTVFSDIEQWIDRFI